MARIDKKMKFGKKKRSDLYSRVKGRQNAKRKPVLPRRGVNQSSYEAGFFDFLKVFWERKGNMNVYELTKQVASVWEAILPRPKHSKKQILKDYHKEYQALLEEEEENEKQRELEEEEEERDREKREEHERLKSIESSETGGSSRRDESKESRSRTDVDSQTKDSDEESEPAENSDSLETIDSRSASESESEQKDRKSRGSTQKKRKYRSYSAYLRNKGRSQKLDKKEEKNEKEKPENDQKQDKNESKQPNQQADDNAQDSIEIRTGNSITIVEADLGNPMRFLRNLRICKPHPDLPLSPDLTESDQLDDSDSDDSFDPPVEPSCQNVERSQPRYYTPNFQAPSTVLYVKNLVQGIKQPELQDIFKLYLSDIVAIRVVDDKSKGEAIVEFKSVGAAERVWKQMNGVEYKRLPMVLEFVDKDDVMDLVKF